jgi:diguanylate cyclase (GGDEF)-like protein
MQSRPVDNGRRIAKNALMGTRARSIRIAAAMTLLLAAAAGIVALAAAGEEGRAVGFWRERAVALQREGSVLWKQQKLRLSLDSFRRALDLYGKNGEPAPAALLRDAGNVAMYLGEYGAALAHLLRGLEEAERRGLPKEAIQCTYLVGYVHRDQNNYPPARRYFRKALEMAEAAGDTRHAILALNELGNVDILEERYPQALSHKQQALDRARAHGDPYVLSACLHDMGIYFSYRGEHARALPYFQEALKIDKGRGDKRGILISLTNIADCLSSLGRLGEAVAAVEEALTTADAKEFPKDIQMVYLNAAAAHARMGNHRRAYDYLWRYKNLNEEIFSREQAETIAELQERYESVKREKENELLRRDNRIQALSLEKQVDLRNFTIALALLVLVTAGTLYWRYRGKARDNARLAAANREIRSQKQALQDAYGKMEALAREDALTGLPNRRVALEALENEAQRSARSGQPFAVLMGDLDGFKAVNDGFGHEAGDAVLKDVAIRLRESLRSQDLVARWGGDEFFFLLPATDRRGAEMIRTLLAEKVRRRRYDFQGRQVSVGLSLGLSVAEKGQAPGECLKEADREMYARKKDRT